MRQTKYFIQQGADHGHSLLYISKNGEVVEVNGAQNLLRIGTKRYVVFGVIYMIQRNLKKAGLHNCPWYKNLRPVSMVEEL